MLTCPIHAASVTISATASVIASATHYTTHWHSLLPAAEILSYLGLPGLGIDSLVISAFSAGVILAWNRGLAAGKCHGEVQALRSPLSREKEEELGDDTKTTR